jgi:branched-chain amino acid aminotransferase/4-amino-4-deoxychorismate lyase
MRARVLERARALGVETRVVTAGPEALATAQAAFLTNSLIGLRPVARFEDRTYDGHALIRRLGEGL